MTSLLEEMDAGDMSLMDSIVKGKEALARLLGVSARTVRRWAKDPVFPKLSGGRYDRHQVQDWLDRRDGREPAARAGKEKDPRQQELPRENGGKDHWDKKAKEWQARTRELEYRKLLGELVERREVEAQFVSRILAVKQGLLALARGLPPQLIHCREEREMEVIVHREVRGLLEAFSRPLPERLGAEGGKGSPEVAGSGGLS
ncbi:MAG: hypothetical protein A2Y80_02110 [Deltaproteobacteria bacterium RBG_13_58_19]|nr:MAG: hypothetical protein A2Y80_02110 [Deltaproteobacteria bacterium RBG_13_58_19]